MTEDRAHKQAIRRRMAQTGERYTEARRALLSASPGALKPGEIRTVIVAWRLDDPAVQEDGRFWREVPEEAPEIFKRPPGTIVPAGQSLAYWRERADGAEVEVPNPITHRKERISIARWAEADPDRVYLIYSFDYLDEALTGRPADEVERIRDDQLARSGGTRIKLRLSDEAKRLKAEQAELQRQFREALDQGDDQRMGELSPALEATAQQLSRAAFPNYAKGWDLSRAIREAPATFVLDWMTGY